MSAPTLREFLLARYDGEVWAIRMAKCPTCLSLQHMPDDPTTERLLADVEAKRRIVGIYTDLWMSEPDEDYPSAPLGGDGPETYYEALQHLAAVYADHPDYRNEWSPDA